MDEWYDVVVVGAGISGISLGHYLKKMCPDLRFLILERRENVGGTWDLFRYPGIRSDSDMWTFGFSWRPWNGRKIIAPGPDILDYLNRTIDDEGLRHHIRLSTDVAAADWSSEHQKWTVSTSTGGKIRCRYLHMGTGYYDYENPYTPDIPGLDTFAGHVVHPQHWTDHDTAACTGKRVVVIGSGATAATLVPSLAKVAESTTMLQRSPGYFASRPAAGDPIKRRIHNTVAAMSPSAAEWLTRWIMVFDQRFAYWATRTFPAAARKTLMDQVRAQVPADFDVDTHFNPSYNPWDQRVCLVPDGDFFRSVRSGKATVVTGTIAEVTSDGISLHSGEHVDADVIVTATGLNLQPNFPMSTIAVTVDGKPYVARDAIIYKGYMLSNVPNFSFTIGYANASWTLKADLVSEQVCEMLQYMYQWSVGFMCPRPRDVEVDDDNVLGLSSGYLKRAEANMPKVGKSEPWSNKQNYLFDLWRRHVSAINDGYMETRPIVINQDLFTSRL